MFHCYNMFSCFTPFLLKLCNLYFSYFDILLFICYGCGGCETVTSFFCSNQSDFFKKFPNFNVFGNFVIIIFENTQKTQYSNNK